MDPGDGKMHKRPKAEFLEEWTGVLLLLLPDETFEKGNTKVSAAKRFWQLLRPHSGVMIQALVGSGGLHHFGAFHVHLHPENHGLCDC